MVVFSFQHTVSPLEAIKIDYLSSYLQRHKDKKGHFSEKQDAKYLYDIRKKAVVLTAV